MDNSVRKAYVAGKFYPATGPEISEMFENIIMHEKPDIRYDLSGKRILGAVLPHAGYMFSGYQAVHFFEILSAGKQTFETYVIIHPIHRGGDLDYAADDHHWWKTPLGALSVDQEFISAMNIEKSGELHKWEHSAEVMLPFIQKYAGADKKIVPVGMGWQHPDASRQIADAIIQAESITGRNVCIIASSDFSHYLDPETGRKKDQLVLDHILKMEVDEIYPVIRKNNISVCGYGPIMSLMYYARAKRPGVKAEILARGNSGDVYPSESVVDYISILFYTDS